MTERSAIDTRLPLYQRLRDEIARNIAKRVWRPGEALPAELELAKSYGVALGTMRKALDTLVADGLLERIQGKGTFVRRADFNASLFRFFRFQSLEGERRIPESRILRREVLPAPSAVASALRIDERSEVIRLSRLRLIDGAPVLAEEIWLPQSRFAALMDIPTGDFGDLLYPLYEKLCGEVVAMAEETLTVEVVRAADARLLRLAAGEPLIVIERLAFNHERSPIEWRRSRGPADQFRYHVEIR